MTQVSGDIAAIAAGLSEAQRAFVLSLPKSGDWKQWRFGMSDPERAGLKGFAKSGWIDFEAGHSGTFVRISSARLALLAYLEGERK